MHVCNEHMNLFTDLDHYVKMGPSHPIYQAFSPPTKRRSVCLGEMFPQVGGTLTPSKFHGVVEQGCGKWKPLL